MWRWAAAELAVQGVGMWRRLSRWAGGGGLSVEGVGMWRWLSCWARAGWLGPDGEPGTTALQLQHCMCVADAAAAGATVVWSGSMRCDACPRLLGSPPACPGPHIPHSLSTRHHRCWPRATSWWMLMWPSRWRRCSSRCRLRFPPRCSRALWRHSSPSSSSGCRKCCPHEAAACRLPVLQLPALEQAAAAHHLEACRLRRRRPPALGPRVGTAAVILLLARARFTALRSLLLQPARHSNLLCHVAGMNF